MLVTTRPPSIYWVGIFVVSRAGEEYDVSKSEILVGFATTVRDAREASGVLVAFELEKAVRVC